MVTPFRWVAVGMGSSGLDAPLSLTRSAERRQERVLEAACQAKRTGSLPGAARGFLSVLLLTEESSMSLPTKEPKGYLTLVDEPKGYSIRAKKEDADALAALYLQYGVSCHRQPDAGPGEDALQFFEGVPRAEIARVLEGYKNAKGS
jgi:hypothetical protein